MADENVLKALKDELEAKETQLVNDFLAEAQTVYTLAPLRHEIAQLEAELHPEKVEEEAPAEAPAEEPAAEVSAAPEDAPAA